MAGLIVVVVLILLVGQVVYYDCERSASDRVREALASAPQRSVRELAGGTVRVTGVAKATAGLLRAPVSQRPCLAYRLEVDVLEGNLWAPALTLRDACPFLVSEASGQILVAPEGQLECALREDHEGDTRVGALDRADRAHLYAVLSAAQIPIRTRWLGLEHEFRFREGVLADGEMVAVRGCVTRAVHPDGERQTPRDPPTALVLRGSSREPLLIGDLAPG